MVWVGFLFFVVCIACLGLFSIDVLSLLLANSFSCCAVFTMIDKMVAEGIDVDWLPEDIKLMIAKYGVKFVLELTYYGTVEYTKDYIYEEIKGLRLCIVHVCFSSLF